MTKIAGSGSITQRHGSADPDPYQNVMDPQHCVLLNLRGYRDWRKNNLTPINHTLMTLSLCVA
jgi:hypothetical protein